MIQKRHPNFSQVLYNSTDMKIHIETEDTKPSFVPLRSATTVVLKEEGNSTNELYDVLSINLNITAGECAVLEIEELVPQDQSEIPLIRRRRYNVENLQLTTTEIDEEIERIETTSFAHMTPNEIRAYYEKEKSKTSSGKQQSRRE